MSGILNNQLIGPLIKSAPLRTYNPGQTIVYPDGSDSNIYVMKNGAVTLETVNNIGERNILYIFGAPTLFPMVTFLNQEVSTSWFHTTLTTTEIYVIPYGRLKDRLTNVDGFTAYNLLLQQILKEYNELLLHISDHSKTSSKEKLISMLLFLLEHHTNKSSSSWRLVRFPINHELLANMTGLTRETISITLKELATMKLIRFQDRTRLELNSNKFSQQSHA